MWRPACLTWLLLTGAAAAAPPYRLTDAVALAARDVRTLPASRRYSTRYLWVPARDAAGKRRTWEVLSGWVNHLSREPDLTPPALVLADGSVRQWPAVAAEDWARLELLRLDLADYRWDPDVYKRLREQSPFTHAEVEGGRGKRDFALAPWLAETAEQQAALAVLVRETESSVPLLRADNFLWQTAIQADRKVGYYGLLEVKNQKDFDKLTGFDRKASADFAKELLAAVSLSGVTRQPRRVARFEKLGGGYWQTFDSRLATDRHNPLRVLTDDFEFDATEIFAALANGLWATGLFNNQGVRQDSAPDFVGGDRATHNNDFRIHVGLSCLRCHADGGLQDVRNWAAGLFRPPFPLLTPDPELARDLRRKYVRRLEPHLLADRARYAAALAEVCGLKPAEFSGRLSRAYAAYDAPVGLERAAFDVGLEPEEFRSKLEAFARASGTLDPVVSGHLRGLADRESLPVEAWHEAIILAQAAVRGYAIPQKYKVKP